MTNVRRIALTVATTGAALTAGLALAVGPGMTAAHADGTDTSKRTVRIVEGSPWVTLEEGDHGYRVAAAACFLDYFDYHQGCDPETYEGADFGPELTEAVKRYEAAKNLPEDGTIDAEVWNELRNDVGEVKAGDGRKDIVRGIQHSLNVLGGEELTVDGIYGAGTEDAVERFQERKEIGVDGIVGPVTLRAMLASGAQAKGLG
ncbi:MAG: hypothetical protein GEV07_03050 [Streptosporangiales bacterium]|nr:hypothetical protein [Streptosporangiales bacterium]